MQLIRDIHASKRGQTRPVISFELFPPKTSEGERALFEATLPQLLRLKPDFCSVTYGAGGSTKEKTLDISHRIQKEYGLTTMAHLTCAGSTRAQIQEYVEQARSLGIRNILALRGDPPGGTGEFQKTEGGFEFSWQLVTYLKECAGFSIGTAGFPEGHVACKEGKQVDWDRLKAKVACGADFVITQLFFDNRDFFEFKSYLERAGVDVPVCPGILPIGSATQLKRFTALCGAKIPQRVAAELDRLGDDDAAVSSFGVDYAIAQTKELIEQGVPALHFYTLNKASTVERILKATNLA